MMRYLGRDSSQWTGIANMETSEQDPVSVDSEREQEIVAWLYSNRRSYDLTPLAPPTNPPNAHTYNP